MPTTKDTHLKIGEILRNAPSSSCPLSNTAHLSLESYPEEILDALIFHRIHFHMDPGLAVKSYRLLRSEFVDWNEVRISPIREIQEQVSKGENSLELSVFIKDLLEFVHHDRHRVELESLPEENLTDIRRYLKQVRNMDPASTDLILMLRKNHPIVPITVPMDQMLIRLGLVREGETRDRKEKSLFELVGPENALAFHHLALNYCRSEGFLEEALFESRDSVLARISHEFGKGRRKTGRKRKASARATARTSKKTKKRKKKSRA